MHPTAHKSTAYQKGELSCRHCMHAVGIVWYLGVHLERQHDLGCAVPPSRHIFGHQAGFLPSGRAGLDAPRKAEIAYFQVAVCVEEEIGWFEIAVDNVSAVDGLEGSQGLVDEVLRR